MQWLQLETDTETFYDTDGDDRGYASLDDTYVRKPRDEDAGYLSMDEVHTKQNLKKKRKKKDIDSKKKVQKCYRRLEFILSISLYISRSVEQRCKYTLTGLFQIIDKMHSEKGVKF